ncbi:hypothetical protein KGO95_00750 [Patescibacteria group bacterium]|nr:hypothetical protein [Patescibacteria group bacterium]
MDPYFRQFQTKRYGRRFRIKIYGSIGVLILLGILAAYTVLDSPVFRVHSFVITGATYHSDQEVLRIIEPLEIHGWLWNLLGPHNLLSWGNDHPDISKSAFAAATVDRSWLHQSITIAVQERDRLAIWCDSYQSCNWIDSTGMAFEDAPQTEGSLILTVNDLDQVHILPGEFVIGQRFLGNLILILKELPSLHLPIRSLSYDGHLEELHAETYSGTKLLFSIRFDPTANISSLQTLEGTKDVAKLSTVDLRVENRLYYK